MEAAGPVVERSTPMVTSANAPNASADIAASAASLSLVCMEGSLILREVDQWGVVQFASLGLPWTVSVSAISVASCCTFFC